jgi:xanthine dehydrogenase YagS FAD-binding subunit
VKPFTYQRVWDVASAVRAASQLPGSHYLAGGTSQVDLMKEGVQTPDRLIDISKIPLTEIEVTASGGVRIGANVKNAKAAEHPLIRASYSGISEALLAGASPQIRNMASMAGNLLQRTRCPYLRDPAQRCNKRTPGTGCAAIIGFNRVHAIFGQTDGGTDSPASCIAVHPSDLAVALAAHDAVLVVTGVGGERRVAFEDLQRLPGTSPERDTNLQADDLIVAIELPVFTGSSHYLKVRDRASYAYALVSCAVALEMERDRIAKAGIALGSVAHKPWRLWKSEAMMLGERPSADLFRAAAVIALEGAKSYQMNDYKVLLSRVLVERALLETSGLEPLRGPAGTAFAASVGGMAGIGDAG